LAQVAVGVLGVFMLASAIPDALWYVVAFTASRLSGPSPLAGQPAYDAQLGLYAIGGIANGAAIAARPLVGALLITRSTTVSAFIIREA